MPYRGLGAIPDTHDPRDLIFEAQPHLMAVAAIPPAVDLRKLCSPIRDQVSKAPVRASRSRRASANSLRARPAHRSRSFRSRPPSSTTRSERWKALPVTATPAR